MFHVLPNPLPWYVVGPLMGVAVAGMYAITNNHLGVSGSFVQLVDRVRSRPIEVWRLWFFAGLLTGSIVATVLGGSRQLGLGYGKLGDLVPLGELVPILFVGGVLIGFGSRWAGACTSGHGLTGCSTRSPGSFVAIATFMVTAVAGTFVLHAATGGAL